MTIPTQRFCAPPVLLSLLLLAAVAPRAAHAQGPVSDVARFKNNLAFIRDSVLPFNTSLSAVLKWEAYGHGIQALAAAAAEEADSISILSNREANDTLTAAAAVGLTPSIWRIMPAGYDEVVEAVEEGYGITEFVGPTNIADVARAANDTGATIPVTLYLFEHYGEAWGWDLNTTEELQALVDTLPPGLEVEGVMMHTSGYEDEAVPGLVSKFLGIVCPLAAAFEAQGRRLGVHWAASDELIRLMPDDALRVELPADACPSGNVDYSFRLGSLIYGSFLDYNEYLEGGTLPVMSWTANVTSVAPDAAGRSVATVRLAAPARFPSPTWWTDIAGYGDNDAPGVPAFTAALISGQPYKLAAVPAGDGTELQLDVTGATVAPGDEVCFICDERPLGSLAEELDPFPFYDVALCLNGWPMFYSTSCQPRVEREWCCVDEESPSLEPL